MSGVILAVPDRPDVTAQVLAGAARLAQLAQCTRINVLAIRVPPAATILPSEEVLTPLREARIRITEQARTDAIRREYEGWRQTHLSADLVAEWFDLEGGPPALIAEWGQRADFIVMKRPLEHQPEPEQQEIHAALFDTERPVLVIPPAPSAWQFGRRVAIAWREDGRTIKAVLSALRWASHADELHVLSGTRDLRTSPAPPQILAEHGIVASHHILAITGQQAFGESLLQTAHSICADMLVMGAFARHPIRSLVLGGVTRYMLAHADLPVLMRH